MLRDLERLGRILLANGHVILRCGGETVMGRGTINVALGIVLAAGTFTAATNAEAGGFALREQSTIGLGMAFAGAAAGSAGLSSMFWNPATATKYPGWNGEQSFKLIAPYDMVKTSSVGFPLNTLGDAGNISQLALLPSGAGSIQITDSLFLGLVTGAPFGLVTKPNDVWQGELYARSSRVFSFNATPSIAYRINDWISVGAGLQIQYFKTRLNSALPLGAPAAFPSFGLEGDNIGVGFTAGVTLTPMVGTTIGLGYRSSIEHGLTGEAGAAGVGVTPIKATIDTPDMVTLGISQVITDRFTLSGGVEWSNWSRFGTFPVYNRNTGGAYMLGPNPVSLAFRYKDSWYFSLGGEYKLDPNWKLRAGIGYEISPITNENRTIRLPDSNRFHLAVGASYQWNERLSFDVGYAHLFTDGAKIDIGPGNPAFNAGFGPYQGKAKTHVDLVSVGLSYRFDSPFVKEKPLVRKY
jgi:long-chain fatty acid transport protein